jgi:reactive intermediate/imine deaminase
MRVTPHYSSAVNWGSLVFTSGQLSFAPGGPPVPCGNFEAECRQALANLSTVLATAGTSFPHVLKVTAFIVGIENWPTFNFVYAELFGDTRPARSVIPVPELHFGCLIEIEAIAGIPAREGTASLPITLA